MLGVIVGDLEGVDEDVYIVDFWVGLLVVICVVK